MAVSNLQKSLVILIQDCSLLDRLSLWADRGIFVLCAILDRQQICSQSLVTEIVQDWCNGVHSSVNNDQLWWFYLFMNQKYKKSMELGTWSQNELIHNNVSWADFLLRCAADPCSNRPNQSARSWQCTSRSACWDRLIDGTRQWGWYEVMHKQRWAVK